MHGSYKSGHSRWRRGGLAPLLAGLGFVATLVSADDSDLCLLAAQDASHLSEVPVTVLHAVAMTESGRTRNGLTRPWPWTVNVEGEGYWFEDRNAARDFAQLTYDRGVRSFDVGCFQINFRWHGDKFVSIDQMFDPLANASYAAAFLKDLHAEKGDWSVAAGAYHSRNEEFAARYRTRFDAFRQAAAELAPDAETAGDAVRLASAGNVAALPRRNDFQLLQPHEGVRSLGSLVPLAHGG